MNYTARPGKPVQTIDLASEPDFEIGAMHVSPALRAVRTPDREELIEPRAMQVLVALVRAGGAVVSRDALIERCWGGRIVGDDAINSCVAKVRALASFTEPPSFEIETIPRVGYRLKLLAGEQPPASACAELSSASNAATDAMATVDIEPRRRTPWKTIVIGVVAILLGSGAVVGSAWLWPKKTGQWSVAKSEMLVATVLIERYPAISPDGSMIAYSAGSDLAGRKIYLRRTSGGPALPVTDDTFDDTSPAWSPDGGQIAYVAYKGGEPCRLMVTAVPAGSPREIARCQSDERSHVSWSVSGRELFFLDRPNRKNVDRLMRYDLPSGRRRELTHPPADSLGDGEPALSPDGRSVVFGRDLSDWDTQHIVLDLGTGAERVLSDRNGGNDTAWSADSQTIFMTSDKGNDFALWAFPVDGGPPSRILSSPARMGRLAAGPDGLLAVEVNAGNYVLARSTASLAAELTILAPVKGMTNAPSVATDGTIVVEGNLSGEQGVWVLPKGGTIHKLLGLRDDETGGGVGLSPDRRYFAFEAGTGPTLAVRIFTLEGREVATIPFKGASAETPSWSPDGRAVIFSGQNAQGWRIWRAETSHPNRLTPVSGTGWQSVKVHDGELYGVRHLVPGVWRIDGSPRRVSLLQTPEHEEDWTIFGDEILYVIDPATQRARIMAQPMDGGPVHLFANVPQYRWDGGFAVDPTDNSVVYVTETSADGDIELLHLVHS